MQRQPSATDALCQVDARIVAELSRVSGSTNLYSRLVALFHTGSADALAQLTSALEASALPPARSVCHKLKSSAANVGAMAFSRQLALLEQRCVAGDLHQARELLAGLQAAHSGLMTELSRLAVSANGAALLTTDAEIGDAAGS